MDRGEGARLAEKFAPSVYRLAYARTGCAADAEDVMQDVFLRLLTKAPRFEDDEHARAWLLRVTANRAVDVLRGRKTVPLEEARVAPAPGKEPVGDEVLEAVLALPDRLRSVVHLFYYEDMSVEEVAQVLGLPRGTVKSRLNRGRARLRELLTEEGGYGLV